MELTLIKTQKYQLEPYGKFVIKWKVGRRDNPNVIPLDELHIRHETGMPMSDEQEKQIVRFMKKSQTDILIAGGLYYTRIGNDLVNVYHKKLAMYRDDEGFKIAVDSGHSFGKKRLTISELR